MSLPGKRKPPRLPQRQAAKILLKRGITPTQQRVEIASILLACEQHLSAEQLLAQVNQHGTVVSQATVYNTLGLLARKGLLREVIVDPAKVFYDSNTKPHYHFFDPDNGNLTDIDIDEMSFERFPALPEGTAIEGMDVIIRLRRDGST
jgi:Fur family iron response transcriptional regulator